MPLSVITGMRDPGEPWTKRDRLFALALTTYEQGLCRGCGQPLRLTTGPHARDYEVESDTCRGCQELEEYTRQPNAGEKRYVVPDEFVAG